MNYNEFSEKIKAKYPQYKDMDNKELAQRMVEKYPQYSDITFDDVEQPKENKGIDLTLSGIGRTMGALTVAPFYAAKTGQKVSDAYNEIQGKLEQKPKTGLEKTVDIASTFALPQAKVLQAGKLAPLANNLVTGAYQGGLIGGVQGLQEGKPLEGLAGGAGVGGTLGAGLPYVGGKIAQSARKALENPNVQNTITSTLEALTSVPQKYSNLALQKELAGQSIFNKAFNPETAYQGVERKLNLAKKSLPSPEYFANQFYNLGQKAKQGIENIKKTEGYKLGEALDALDDKVIEGTGIQHAVGDIINSYGKGGVYNSALEEAPQVVNYLENNLTKEGLTHRDLDRIKNRLYDMGYAASQNREGTAAEVARGTAEQINNYLRAKNPAYIQPNDRLSLVHNLEQDLGGINSSTIGKKLQDYGDPKNLIGGVDMKLKNINDILPIENQFIDDTQRLINEQGEIANIQKLVGNKYTKNPRLLANVTDEATEQALADLQRKSNISFMDELQETRARDLLEKIAPGQGGGSGSEQGFFNNVVRPVIGSIGRGAGGALIGSTVGGPLGAVAGLAAVSPKIMAKGTIQNLGNFYRGLNNPLLEQIPRLMTVGGVNMLPLQGGLQYNDYK